MPDSEDIELLAEQFRRLGAADPEAWAASQIEEGIPQLARFVFLSSAWKRVLGDGDTTWIDQEMRYAEAEPSAPFAGIGHALARLRQAGAADVDLADLARGMQARLLFDLCALLDDPGPEPLEEGIAWGLAQLEENNVVAWLDGMHESVLETDPTRREMRPRAANSGAPGA